MNKLIWAVLLLISIKKLNAQDTSTDFRNFIPHFEVVTLPGGSLGNSVQGMVQDSTGFLWFASQAGLIRYDGQNFEVYRFDPNNPNSLLHDYVECLFLDSKGLLWMTHWEQGGLTSYDPEHGIFSRYVHNPDDPESLCGNTLSVVAEDRQGNIWVGGEDGLNRFDRKTGKFKRFQHDPGNPNSLSYDRVRALYIDKQGTLWVGTGFPWDFESSEGGLNRFNPATESFTRYLHDPRDPGSLINNKIRALYEDSKGNFWVGTCGDGLHRMDREKGTFTRLSYEPASPGKLTIPFLKGQTPATMTPGNHVSSIFEDQNGRIWITSVYGGLTVFDPVHGRIHRFEKGNAPGFLRSNYLWQTYQTRDGTVWICTGSDGQVVYRVKEQNNLFPFYATPPRPDDHLSFSHGILKDRMGFIWIAHENPVSLRRVDRKTNATILVPVGDNQYPVNRIYGLTLDREGFIWVGTDYGQFRGNPETMKFERFQPRGIKDDILNSLCFPMLQISSGIYWFGSWGTGLSSWDPKSDSLMNYRHDPGEPNSLWGNNIWGLYEDSKGVLWVGGGNPFGNAMEPLFLDRFSPESNRFEHFIKSKELGMVTDISEDQSGNIWFSDWIQGFQKLDPIKGSIKKFSTYNSLLPSPNLFSLSKTENNKFWFSSDHNLIEFDPETETFSVYNEGQGVVSANGYFNSGSLSEDGELLFSRMGGFHAFYPDELIQKKNLRLPDIRITGFRLFGEENLAGGQDILEKPIWQTSSITLSHEQNVFSLSIACFDYYDASAVQLQFRLEGYDKAWRKNSGNGEIPSYINVPPGEYTFRVRGANSFGIWNMEGASLTVTILPPWWKSGWAYAFYGVLLALGIYFFNRYMRQRIIQRERQKIMEKELAQAKEIEKAYSELKSAQAQLIHSERMASLGELTAGIAHEIQNPLNFVNNFSEVNKELIDEMGTEMDRGNLEEAKTIANNIKENQEKITQHGKRADAIVKGMLQHSRTSSGVKEPTDINALADEYLRLAYHGLRAKDKSFNALTKTDFDSTIGSISLIRQDIGRVMLNLITNAFYAVSEKKKLYPTSYEPTVTITTKKAGDKIKISVSDNGNGIPQEFLEKVFQPFFTTKPTGEGTGLGLSISYDIIKSHQGELKVETKEGFYTTFIIQLPVK